MDHPCPLQSQPTREATHDESSAWQDSDLTISRCLLLNAVTARLTARLAYLQDMLGKRPSSKGGMDCDKSLVYCILPSTSASQNFARARPSLHDYKYPAYSSKYTDTVYTLDNRMPAGQRMLDT